MANMLPQFALSKRQKKRRTVRAPVNALDKCTIISIYPKRISERKATLQPGVFNIEPGTYEKPSLLVVGSSSWWKDVDPDQPLLEIPTWSTTVAKSVVNDYVNGLFGYNPGSAMPGLFWVEGEYESFTAFIVKPGNKALLEAAKVKQNNYYNNLIKSADMLWARSNGNPLAISDDMRLAARELGVHGGKDWMKDFTITTEMSKCPACGTLRNSQYPICPTCKTICDPEKAKAMGIKFAQTA
jgi:hypothetical protein